MGAASFHMPEGLRTQQVAEKEPGWQDFLRQRPMISFFYLHITCRLKDLHIARDRLADCRGFFASIQMAPKTNLLTKSHHATQNQPTNLTDTQNPATPKASIPQTNGPQAGTTFLHPPQNARLLAEQI